MAGRLLFLIFICSVKGPIVPILLLTILTQLIFSQLRMRDDMFRRGALRLPGIPTDPYLEASRRFAAPSLPSPYPC